MPWQVVIKTDNTTVQTTVEWEKYGVNTLIKALDATADKFRLRLEEATEISVKWVSSAVDW